MTPRPADTAFLHDDLRRRLHPEAADWLDTALREAADTPADGARLPAWERHFASAGRRCRPSAQQPPPTGPGPAEAADAARVLILHAARADAHTLTRVYSRGSADERRAVLLALPYLVTGPDAVPLVEDALRVNDTRLIAAAVGPYAGTYLEAPAWRQAVLKCLFTGVPLDAVAGLAERARGDAELARMLTDYAAERTAAGRPVPDDLKHALTLTAAADTKEC